MMSTATVFDSRIASDTRVTIIIAAAVTVLLGAGLLYTASALRGPDGNHLIIQRTVESHAALIEAAHLNKSAALLTALAALLSALSAIAAVVG